MTLDELRNELSLKRGYLNRGEIEDLFDQLEPAGWEVLHRTFNGSRNDIVDEFCSACEEG